jgi:hypothetical protein
MSWVFQHSESTGNDRLVLLALADRANEVGDDCWPAIPTIAKKARCSDRTVQRALQNLVNLGELAVDKGAGYGGSNRYRILMGGDNLTPRQDDTGDTADTRVVTLVSPNTSLHQINPPTPASGGSNRRQHCEAHRRWRGECANCRRANEPPPTPKPQWCGECDERTRLREVTGGQWGEFEVRRCPTCHPLTQT